MQVQISSSSRVSSSGNSPLDNFTHFLSLLLNAWSHMDSILNPNDRTPISSTFFLTTLFVSPFFHPKPLLYLSHSLLILILMLLLISGDIHPNPGPIDPCSVCSRRVTWGNRSIQCTNCFLWVHLSCSGFSPSDFCKISPEHFWTCPICPSSSQTPSLSHPNRVLSSIYTPNPLSPLTNNHKTISSKMPPPK